MMKEHITIDKKGVVTGSNGALLSLWMQQEEMGIEVMGQIPLCG